MNLGLPEILLLLLVAGILFVFFRSKRKPK